MRSHLPFIPDKILRQYNLLLPVHNGYIYLKIRNRNSMYNLLIAGKCANNDLNK